MSSFGETLRRERELRGIDLREVAEATKISVRFLQALENDRVDVLPGGIFPRAFVRQYANYLGLDPERTVADFLYRVRRRSGHGRAEPAPRRRSRPLPLGLCRGGPGGPGAWALLAWRELRSAPVEPTVAAARRRPRRRATFPSDRVYPPPDRDAAGGSPTEGLVLELHGATRAAGWPCRPTACALIDRVLAEGETQSAAGARASWC